MKIRKISLSFTFSKILRTWSFHVVILPRTAKKCTKIPNARAQPLLCSLNLLFCGVLVAVAVAVCLRNLMYGKKNSWSRGELQRISAAPNTSLLKKVGSYKSKFDKIVYAQCILWFITRGFISSSRYRECVSFENVMNLIVMYWNKILW